MTEPVTTHDRNDAVAADLAEATPINLQDEIFTPGPPAASAVFGNGLIGRMGAEFFGTFLLVFVGVGAALFGSILGFGQLGIALAFGIALMAAIAAVGGVSGGHFNPAVTFGLTLAGRSSWRDLLPYWVSQVAGGAFATLILWATTPRELNVLPDVSSTARAELFQGAANGFGAHSPAFDGSGAQQVKDYLAQGVTADQIKEAVDAGQVSFNNSIEFTWTSALIMETVAVALLVGVILAVTDVRSKIKAQPVVIGLSFAALLAIAIPLTNGSLNPARSFAAAIFAGGWTWGQLWVFVAAPLLGGAIAALFYRGFAAPNSFAAAGVVMVDETSSWGTAPYEADLSIPSADFDDEFSAAATPNYAPVEGHELVLEEIEVDLQAVLEATDDAPADESDDDAGVAEADDTDGDESDVDDAEGEDTDGDDDEDDPEGDTVLR